MMSRHYALLTTVASLLVVVMWAANCPGAIEVQLTGDIRDENPSGLIVDVTITFDGFDASIATFEVDINSPLHPDIKLDEFYFNLAGVPDADVSFADFDPEGWSVNSPATVQGAGGTTFMFETLDPSGPPNADNVTNDQTLTFVATLSSGIWSEANFIPADIALSNDAGSGQMGAHLQSLTLGNPDDPATEDSGFAFGDYPIDGHVYPPPPPPIPEPVSVMVWSLLGMIGVAVGYRRKYPG